MTDPNASHIFVSKDVFDAKMETQNVRMEGIKDELRSFKRTLTTTLVVGIPVLTAIAQFIVNYFQKG